MDLQTSLDLLLANQSPAVLTLVPEADPHDASPIWNVISLAEVGVDIANGTKESKPLGSAKTVQEAIHEALRKVSDGDYPEPTFPVTTKDKLVDALNAAERSLVHGNITRNELTESSEAFAAFAKRLHDLELVAKSVEEGNGPTG